MKYIFLFLFMPVFMAGQSGNEIFVFKLEKKGQNFSISEPIRISDNNPGYDNQPHFLSDGSLYYVGNREGQTEVIQVRLDDDSRTQLTNTKIGSEYSPTPIPGSQDFSAIRLDTTGLQLLYRYSKEKEDPEVILPNTVVGYHQWVDPDKLLAFVLGEPSTLQLCNVKKQDCEVMDRNIGRSIHKIPGSKNDLMSYVSKKNESWEIRSFNPETGETEKIIEALPGSEDLAWSPDGTIFMGNGNTLYKFHPAKDETWVVVAELSKFGLEGISRLAISPRGDRVAVVVDE